MGIAFVISSPKFVSALPVCPTPFPSGHRGDQARVPALTGFYRNQHGQNNVRAGSPPGTAAIGAGGSLQEAVLGAVLLSSTPGPTH